MAAPKDNPIVNLTFEFSLGIMDYAETLNLAHKWVISNQVLRAGTSIGANVKEAQNAESKADFIHKIKVAAKEADEVEYFLSLCKQSIHYPDCDELLEKIVPIKKTLNKIIATSKGSS